MFSVVLPDPPALFADNHIIFFMLIKKIHVDSIDFHYIIVQINACQFVLFWYLCPVWIISFFLMTYPPYSL